MSTEQKIRNHLVSHFPTVLVDDVIDNYLEVKEKFYLREYRETSLYGGRYAEDLIRILQHITTGNFTPLGTSLGGFHNIVVRLNGLPNGSYHDSIRLYIPKALDILYDIRNNRNVGHPSGDIDENYSDAVLSLSLSSWTLVELLRLYYVGDINQAQQLVNELVRIRVPLIQDFDGYLRVLDPKLPLRKKIIGLLLHRSAEGISKSDLCSYLKHNHPPNNVGRSLTSLVRSALVHFDEVAKLYYITDAGTTWAENNIKFDL